MASHVLDLIQNSISANATLMRIITDEDISKNRYILTIEDNGKGMSPEFLSKVTDPYTTTRTTRKVGMGLPLLKQNVEITGGTLEIHSQVGVGTVLKASFVMDHIDRIPVGDMVGVIGMLTAMNPTLDFIYEHKNSYGNYLFDTREVKAVLDNVSISDPQIQHFLKEMIEENLLKLHSRQ
ncbi:MAG: ATP-binding protein [Bacteroidales bacterium]